MMTFRTLLATLLVAAWTLPYGLAMAAQTVEPAKLSKLPAEPGVEIFEPRGEYLGDPADHGYVSEEWIAEGEVDGKPYRTVVFVRRPSDPAQFSGTLIVEPLHAASAAPIWIYTSEYQLREGHASAVVYSQKSAVETFVKPTNPERYESLHIWSDEPTGADQDPMSRRMAMNALSTPILAQAGAALRDTGPLADYEVKHVILVGHSQTGGVVTNYILDGHDNYRLAGGAPIYDGFFPSGAPRAPFGPLDVPLVQTLSEGDISDPHRPGREGRPYRRPDSDDANDRYRLYELAGVAHMGTHFPPYDDPMTWANDPTGTSGAVPEDARLNSMPHGAMFSVTLHHLVRWVTDGVTPPRADRIEVGPNGLFAADEFGNSRGGVRSAQLDVPRLKYYPNPGVTEDGTPARGVVGFEEPLPEETLRRLYPSHDAYVQAFNRRVEELVAEGWLLPEDADAMREEAANAVLY